MLEGLIGCLYLPFLFFFDSTYKDINSFYEKRNEKLRFILLIFLLFTSYYLIINYLIILIS